MACSHLVCQSCVVCCAADTCSVLLIRLAAAVASELSLPPFAHALRLLVAGILIIGSCLSRGVMVVCRLLAPHGGMVQVWDVGFHAALALSPRTTGYGLGWYARCFLHDLQHLQAFIAGHLGVVRSSSPESSELPIRLRSLLPTPSSQVS